MSDLLVIRTNCLQETSESLKKFIFFVCFWLFSPFYAQEHIAPIALCMICSFLKSDLSDSLQSLFTKRVTVSDSLRSLMTKERGERFTLFHKQIALGSQKWVNRLKNRWANSQPCPLNIAVRLFLYPNTKIVLHLQWHYFLTRIYNCASYVGLDKLNFLALHVCCHIHFCNNLGNCQGLSHLTFFLGQLLGPGKKWKGTGVRRFSITIVWLTGALP